jgi:spore coat polysaccharide biosynthesis protein SpsF
VKILAVVQARMGSSRLPGKILLPLAGAPLLQRMIERVQAASEHFDLVVATTTDPADDPVRALCARIGVDCFSGHPTDLLDRHVMAARARGADAVAKIPSDCPLIDPAAIDAVLSTFRTRRDLDYVSNLHPQSWPDGNDVEVMRRAALEAAHAEATAPFQREHTTPFLWDQPERFRIGNVARDGPDLSRSLRFTIDYPEDHRLLARIFAELWTPEEPVFSLETVLRLLEARPDIRAINERWLNVNWYRHHLGELRTVGAADTRIEETA